MNDKMATVTAAFGLSERQSIFLRTLVAAGGIREAASVLQLPYTSARNLVAELKVKLGVATVPMMIGLLLDLVLDDESGGQVRRHDLFSLSKRQFEIAGAMSFAKSRQEIAATLNISAAVLDAELKEIYLILGVQNAGAVIRIVADHCYEPGERDGSIAHAPVPGHDLPLGIVPNGARRIGYSDYGPVEGVPVLILHSTITSRAPPTRLVAALQARGFRPLAIDRPGFGDTDPGGALDDPYRLAAQDAAIVCEALGLSWLDVVARGSGQAAVRLAQILPALIRRAVLVNPTPSIAFTAVHRGPLGAAKQAIGKRPYAVEALIRVAAPYATPRRLHDGMLRSYRDSPPDFDLARNDAQFVADYLRAVRGFGLGHIAGWVAEQSAWGGGYDVEPLPDMKNWRIVQGRHFLLHHPDQAMTYWRARLPDTPVIWADDAGQMLAYSHPAMVVAALCQSDK